MGLNAQACNHVIVRGNLSPYLKLYFYSISFKGPKCLTQSH
jgi:hypothetical protein